MKVRGRTYSRDYHLENWNAKADEQISYDRTALLCSCGHHGFHRSNLIEATGSAKKGSRDGGIEPSLDTCRCGVIQFSEDSRENGSGTHRYHSKLEPY
jgi:hypothetical protein